MDISQTCFFSGHRETGEAPYLPKAVGDAIGRAYEAGFRRFVCGGALGFDTIAAQGVLRWREREGAGDVELWLILPHRGQERSWRLPDQEVYRQLLEQADHLEFLQESYTPGCMFRRNRAMADCSSRGIFFYDGRKGGGTAYTLKYFLRRNPGREGSWENLWCPPAEE